MTLARQRYQQIPGEAARFSSKSHVSFLSDAMHAAQRADSEGRPDPGLESLNLLGCLWRSCRPDQKNALNNVGQWLERRLTKADVKTILQERIMEDIGWMKREATAVSASAADARTPGPRDTDPRGRRETIKRGFGDDIEGLRLKRQRLRDKAERISDQPRAPASPIGLPARFEALFDDFILARGSVKKHRQRVSAKKSPRDKVFYLHPSSSDLTELAKGLYLSTLSTEGFLEFFDYASKKGGAAVAFFVEGTRETPQGRLALRIVPA